MRGRLTSAPMDSLRGVIRGETPRFKSAGCAAPVPRVAFRDRSVRPVTLPGVMLRVSVRARSAVEGARVSQWKRVSRVARRWRCDTKGLRPRAAEVAPLLGRASFHPGTQPVQFWAARSIPRSELARLETVQKSTSTSQCVVRAVSPH